MKVYIGSLILIIFMTFCNGDDVEIEVQSGLMLKMLRDMANQTDANPLNLPANASSIRENITDTFSCENKTYGYYADVDNECQVFHVCLPSQTPSGRNVTYKWSFICPNETIFNQEVLVCTRPADSIPCEESPNYYDLNMEIGKVPNNTKKETNDIKEGQKIQRRKPDNRKQALLEKLMEEIVYENIDQKIDENDAFDENINVFPIVDMKSEKYEKFVPNLNNGEYVKEEFENEETVKVDVANGETVKVMENGELDERLAMERSMGSNLKKSSFRFRADV